MPVIQYRHKGGTDFHWSGSNLDLLMNGRGGEKKQTFSRALNKEYNGITDFLILNGKVDKTSPDNPNHATVGTC